MTEIRNNRKYDLEDRTFKFAKEVRELVKSMPKAFQFHDDVKQLIRSSGSIGANYIEGNDSLSKKDLIMRIKICRKEAKETGYWLRLIDAGSEFDVKLEALLNESRELMNIFGAILKKLETRNSKYEIN